MLGFSYTILGFCGGVGDPLPKLYRISGQTGLDLDQITCDYKVTSSSALGCIS